MEERSVIDVVLGVLGGGGIVSLLFRLYTKSLMDRIEELWSTIEYERSRAEKAEETVYIAAQSLPAIEALLDGEKK